MPGWEAVVAVDFTGAELRGLTSGFDPTLPHVTLYSDERGAPMHLPMASVRLLYFVQTLQMGPEDARIPIQPNAAPSMDLVLRDGGRVRGIAAGSVATGYWLHPPPHLNGYAIFVPLTSLSPDQPMPLTMPPPGLLHELRARAAQKTPTPPYGFVPPALPPLPPSVEPPALPRRSSSGGERPVETSRSREAPFERSVSQKIERPERSVSQRTPPLERSVSQRTPLPERSVSQRLVRPVEPSEPPAPPPPPAPELERKQYDSEPAPWVSPTGGVEIDLSSDPGSKPLELDLDDDDPEERVPVADMSDMLEEPPLEPTPVAGMLYETSAMEDSEIEYSNDEPVSVDDDRSSMPAPPPQKPVVPIVQGKAVPGMKKKPPPSVASGSTFDSMVAEIDQKKGPKAKRRG